MRTEEFAVVPALPPLVVAAGVRAAVIVEPPALGGGSGCTVIGFVRCVAAPTWELICAWARGGGGGNGFMACWRAADAPALGGAGVAQAPSAMARATLTPASQRHGR